MANKPAWPIIFVIIVLIISYICLHLVEIDLTNGEVKNGWSVQVDTQNVQVRWNLFEQDISLTLPMTFQNIMFTHDYRVRILGRHREDKVESDISSLKGKAKLGFNYESKVITLRNFAITDYRNVSDIMNFNLTGNDDIDGLLNPLAKALYPKEIVSSIIVDVVDVVRQIAVDEMNGLFANGTSLATASAALKDLFWKNAKLHTSP